MMFTTVLLVSSPAAIYMHGRKVRTCVFVFVVAVVVDIDGWGSRGNRRLV